jgi:hypothetical protein
VTCVASWIVCDKPSGLIQFLRYSMFAMVVVMIYFVPQQCERLPYLRASHVQSKEQPSVSMRLGMADSSLGPTSTNLFGSQFEDGLERSTCFCMQLTIQYLAGSKLAGEPVQSLSNIENRCRGFLTARSSCYSFEAHSVQPSYSYQYSKPTQVRGARI